MGILAVTISGLWSGRLVTDALKAPVIIGSLPIGIFQVVLIVSIIIFLFRNKFSNAVIALANRLSVSVFIFIIIALMGLLSSVVSVIPMSVLLAEVVVCLPLNRQDRIKLVVVTCYSIGLGAVLTPLGEPLSTILVQKLAGTPFYAGFTFPFTTFAKYIIPGIFGLAIFGAMWIGRKATICETATESQYSETWLTVIIRAVKVYAFIAALMLLGEGLKPLIVWFLIRTSPFILFWANMVSAVLDNATLTAMEINTGMMLPQIICITMGLLIAGGMLIPGNIPNIVAAGKLKISMKEWAVIGVPVGLVTMAIYFVILLPVMLGISSG